MPIKTRVRAHSRWLLRCNFEQQQLWSTNATQESSAISRRHHVLSIFQGFGTFSHNFLHEPPLLTYSSANLSSVSPEPSPARPSVAPSSPLLLVKVLLQTILSIWHDTAWGTPANHCSADLVQDLYLKELKAYKTPAVKPNDSEGHVQTFHIPSAPQSPEEADIAKDLSAYETQVPEVEGQAEGGAAAPVEDWFDESIFEDEEPHH